MRLEEIELNSCSGVYLYLTKHINALNKRQYNNVDISGIKRDLADNNEQLLKCVLDNSEIQRLHAHLLSLVR